MYQLSTLQTIVVAIIPVLFAITLHEVAHGWTARHFGDRTAEMMGRLTVNPVKHIDPIGTIVVPGIMLVVGGFLFGWAKPVPIGVRNLRNPHRDMIFVAAAGPASNLLMAIFWAFVARFVAVLGLQGDTALYFIAMAQIGVIINVVLCVFNLLPLPPLDGGRVLAGLLPPKQAVVFERIEPYGLVIIMALLFTGVLGSILGPLIGIVRGLVLSVAGF
ncbi:MAG: site-2 protease family protein [Gammaproteobacteria bacterium]